jgi:hypothetical protein
MRLKLRLANSLRAASAQQREVGVEAVADTASNFSSAKSRQKFVEVTRGGPADSVGDGTDLGAASDTGSTDAFHRT